MSDDGSGAPAPGSGLRRALSRLIAGWRAERRAERLEARRLAGAGLVAPRWYRRSRPGVARAAAEHYLRRGAAEGHDTHPGFSARLYGEQFPASRDGTNPLSHFLDRARREDADLPEALRCGLDGLPARLHTGAGAALFVRGWAYATRGRARALALVVGDAVVPVADHSEPRADVLDAEYAHDPEGNSFLSGFEAVVPLPPVPRPEERRLRLRLTTRAGAVLEREVGTLTLLPGDGRAPAAVAWPAPGARVAVCMATHAPPLDLFAAQVASIRAQTHRAWVCIVCDDASPPAVVERMRPILDDPRFVFLENRERLGFYGNFERALRAVPADADFVALSDQDDRWHPDKLETLVGAMDGEAQLAFADARVVDPDGRELSPTFWTGRRNNFTSLPALLSANTVMGAACLFRAALLDRVLPFPERLGAAYHDHWIALNALTAGTVRYLDRPLHDYVQHGGNVIGYKRDRDAPGLLAAGRALAEALPHGLWRVGPLLRDIGLEAAADRSSLVAQKAVLARVLLMRHPAARPAARAALGRMAGLTRLGPALGERLRAALERRPTLNHEGRFLRAVLISRARASLYGALRGPQAARIRRRRYVHGLRRLTTEGDGGRIDFRHSGHGRDMRAMDFGHVGWIFHNVRPLTLRVSAADPVRVNLLLATINFDVLFGGYIGMFNFALRLGRAGRAVRIVLLDHTDVQVEAWRARIARYPGLAGLFDAVEIAYRHDRALPLDVSPQDRFVATSGWSAHVAHKASAALGQDRFLFLIQEYEPFFGPMNTNTALLRQAYDFPHFGLFSTALLRDYFRDGGIGLFGEPGGEARSAVFSNAIQRFAPTRAQLERRSRRILFYARPEEHAARNMFEMGVAALVALFSDPEVRAAGWTAHGIGSIDAVGRLELAPGAFLRMVPKTSLQGYAEMLPTFDVGLSLMMTPHPSLVPLEMAAAGLPTVTNTFANKTAAALEAISPNLIGAAPTLDGIVAGLRTAIGRVDDVEARLAGARAMTWPTDWDAAFPADSMARVEAFLGG